MGKISIPNSINYSISCSIPYSINCSISWALRCFPHTHLRYNNQSQTGGRRRGQAGRRHQTFSQTRVSATGTREETWLTPFTGPRWVTHRFNTIKEVGAGRNSCSFTEQSPAWRWLATGSWLAATIPLYNLYLLLLLLMTNLIQLWSS